MPTKNDQKGERNADIGLFVTFLPAHLWYERSMIDLKCQLVICRGQSSRPKGIFKEFL